LTLVTAKQGLDTGHNNVHNTASQIAELRAQVEADYQAVISQGKSAGYLPPVNLKQGLLPYSGGGSVA
jgi:hypothetical protein